MSDREELIDESPDTREQHPDDPSTDSRRRSCRVILVRDYSPHFRVRAVVGDERSLEEHQMSEGLVSLGLFLYLFIVEELLRLLNDDKREPRIVFVHS